MSPSLSPFPCPYPSPSHSPSPSASPSLSLSRPLSLPPSLSISSSISSTFSLSLCRDRVTSTMQMKSRSRTRHESSIPVGYCPTYKLSHVAHTTWAISQPQTRLEILYRPYEFRHTEFRHTNAARAKRVKMPDTSRGGDATGGCVQVGAG